VFGFKDVCIALMAEAANENLTESYLKDKNFVLGSQLEHSWLFDK
jgi:hypothetical protein